MKWVRLHCARLHKPALQRLPSYPQSEIFKSTSRVHKPQKKQRQKTQPMQWYSVGDLSVCILLTSLFYPVMTFPRAAEQRGGGEGKLKKAGSGEAENHTESLCISRKHQASAALSNDTADQCRSGAHIMAFARRLKPLFEINNFSSRSSEVMWPRRWRPEHRAFCSFH